MASSGLLQRLDPARFSLPEVACIGPPVDLDVGTANVGFDLVHGALLAFPEQGLPLDRGWQLDSWAPMAISWLPTQNDVREKQELREMKKEEIEISCTLVGRGEYLVVKANPPIKDLVAFIQAQQVQLLWDASARKWISGITLPWLAFGSYDVGPQHIVLFHGGHRKIVPRELGKEIDFTRAPVSFKQDGKAVLSHDGRHVVFVTPPQYDKGGGLSAKGKLTVRELQTGKLVQETVYLPPPVDGEEQKYRDFPLPALTQEHAVFVLANFAGDPYRFFLQDLVSGKLLCDPLVPESKVQTCDRLPDRGLLAFVREPAVLEIWQLPSRRRLLVEELPAAPAGLRFSADGRYLAVSGSDKKTVRVYTLAGKELSVGEGARASAGRKQDSPGPPALAGKESTVKALCPNPECGKKLLIPERLRGKTLRCPACATQFSVKRKNGK